MYKRLRRKSEVKTMRDPKRIKKILEQIELIWNLNSDQRFFQMLINNGMIDDDNAHWHLEDDKVEEHLGKIIKKYKINKK